MYLSTASLWEIAIKSQSGKLTLHRPFHQIIEKDVYGRGLIILVPSTDHLIEIQRLPLHHRDPFDRLIIAQSIVEHLPVITTDSKFDRYEIERVR